MLPHLKCGLGDTIYIRATVLEACSDYFKVRIEDFPSIAITTFVPVSEIAKADDIAGMRMPHRSDLKYLDPAHNGVVAQKLPK